jgi:hypothetical protein
VDLFAWTAVVIILSVLFEYLFVLAIKRVGEKYPFSKAGRRANGIERSHVYKKFGGQAVWRIFSRSFPIRACFACSGRRDAGKRPC